MSALEEYFENLSLESLVDYKKKCDEKYYNNNGNKDDCITDDVYDILEEVIKKKCTTNLSSSIGVKTKINQIKLPFFMGSMNKLKTDKEINKWITKHTSQNFIVQEKLDGVSCLVIYNNKSSISLFTRGDGTVGSNISHLVPFLSSSLPKLSSSSLIIRGELIMKKKTFNEKYSSSYSNSRNLVSGVVNSTVNIKKEIIKDIDFVAYELLNIPSLICEKQLNLLNEYGFNVVVYNTIINNTDVEKLTMILTNMKSNSKYQIDGIIIHSNDKYIRNTKGNPEYAFAFKMRSEDNCAEATVIDVEWNITKWNVLKPRIKINPVSLCGVNINYLTGFNARYIKDNSIGKNSILLITRSNDVIPYILKIIKPTIPDLPSPGTYHWNETNIDIIVNDDEDETMSGVKLISFFFNTLNIKQISDATVDKMFSYGLNTLEKILKAKVSDFEKIDGFGKKLAERTYTNIKNGLKDVPLYLLIAASSTLGFGLGIKKVKKIFDTLPNILEDKNVLLYDKLMDVEGLSHKSTIQIIDNLQKTRDFYTMIKPFVTLTIISSIDKTNMKVCFSGFRDIELETKIESQGGKIVSSISKNTSYLIVKNENDSSSSKIEKAKQSNVPIITVSDFTKLFNLILL